MVEHDWFPRPLPPNVSVGEGSWLHSSYALLHYRSEKPSGLKIGRDSGVYIGTYFDLGPDAEVEIGDYTVVAGATFATNGRVTVGDHVLISGEVVIADHPFPVPGEASPVGPSCISIGDLAWVGTRVVLLAGTRLGTGAIVGAGSVVDSEVPDYAIVAGNPARVVGSAAPGEDKGRRP